MEHDFPEMARILMRELRLYHQPVAITWLFGGDDVRHFRETVEHVEPVKPLTFCQWELAARMQGRILLGMVDSLGCRNAQFSFGWQEVDEHEIKTQLKYCRDPEQTRRFLLSKPHMEPDTLQALVVSPLEKTTWQPHVVHFYCDSLQAYHLAVDYMAATDTHPLRTQITMSSSCCGGAVYCWQENTFNHSPPCSGSYNAGKTDRSETYVFIPGSQIGLVVERLLERMDKSGSSSITSPGDPFPGSDICKNCPLIIFKKEGPGHRRCADCKKA